MVYELKSDDVLIRIDRTLIIDIAEGDELQLNELFETSYQWKHQDSQFVESNPDAEIYLRLQRTENSSYEPVTLVIREKATT